MVHKFLPIVWQKSKDVLSYPFLTLAKIYFTAIFIFFIFRVILFVTEIHRVSLADDGFVMIVLAFLMGVRFDTVITSYILALPLLILFLFDFFKIQHRFVSYFVFVFVFTFFSIAFIISMADIPYFHQFFSRFSVAAFEWMDTPDIVFKMILQEPTYFLYAVPAIIAIFIFYKIVKKVIFNNKISQQKIFIKIIIFLFAIVLVVLGTRGRFARKSPIRVGTAYFCNNSFLNQLGLNPSFTLLHSYLEKNKSKNKIIKLIDSNIAQKNVQKYIGIKKTNYDSPIARMVKTNIIAKNKPNIVVVIMESMSAAKMKRHGNKKNLTPFLDELSQKSIYFENIYTAGKHTFNGVFGTLFSFPALFHQHPMKQEMRKYNNIGYVLKRKGYHTIYFTTHDGQFDNVEGFLLNNDFKQVISQKNYPAKEVKTALGVPDDYMFRFSIPVLNKIQEPFFAAFMTVSDHGPFYIPDYFSPTENEMKNKIVQYADWSLKTFMELAQKQNWYKNTIFVFIADHGAPITTTYDISLDYHHSPLIIYQPNKKAKLIKDIGGQIDVFPTLMGMLNFPYINNTMGIDLLKEKREYIVINDDDQIGVLDNQFLFIFDREGKRKLYKYRDHDKTNYVEQLPEKAKEMETYGKSMMQVTQDMLVQKQTFVTPHNKKEN